MRRGERRDDGVVADAPDRLHLEREHARRRSARRTRRRSRRPMAAISSRRRSARRSAEARRTTASVRLPDICIAVPSRPAEPPKRWVATVPTSTSGAMRRGTHAVGSWISSMMRLLPSPARPREVVVDDAEHAGRRPAAGTSSQPCSSRGLGRPVQRHRGRRPTTARPARPTTPPSTASHATWATGRSSLDAIELLCSSERSPGPVPDRAGSGRSLASAGGGELGAQAVGVSWGAWQA